ncbi:Oidioi.mRNA.OKI2018_I69.chr1.g3519.t1.cds [Oikopleura dioica]|uniref:Oidioi.mRNA.OKI2018_I69.chr1.g3519.t1.cds n=1 Tax=Oikopleura dioica TaxID=34765 RepID=A0ABN7SW36_OIKDI|nr:Oidioi.mRNA.OKI2018_I69.chr1.g3519.t1.cds [Oikopleura dioica]
MSGIGKPQYSRYTSGYRSLVKSKDYLQEITEQVSSLDHENYQDLCPVQDPTVSDAVKAQQWKAHSLQMCVLLEDQASALSSRPPSPENPPYLDTDEEFKMVEPLVDEPNYQSKVLKKSFGPSAQHIFFKNAESRRNRENNWIRVGIPSSWYRFYRLAESSGIEADISLRHSLNGRSRWIMDLFKTEWKARDRKYLQLCIDSVLESLNPGSSKFRGDLLVIHGGNHAEDGEAYVGFLGAIGPSNREHNAGERFFRCQDVLLKLSRFGFAFPKFRDREGIRAGLGCTREDLPYSKNLLTPEDLSISCQRLTILPKNERKTFILEFIRGGRCIGTCVFIGTERELKLKVGEYALTSETHGLKTAGNVYKRVPGRSSEYFPTAASLRQHKESTQSQSTNRENLNARKMLIAQKVEKLRLAHESMVDEVQNVPETQRKILRSFLECRVAGDLERRITAMKDYVWDMRDQMARLRAVSEQAQQLGVPSAEQSNAEQDLAYTLSQMKTRLLRKRTQEGEDFSALIKEMWDLGFVFLRNPLSIMWSVMAKNNERVFGCNDCAGSFKILDRQCQCLRRYLEVREQVRNSHEPNPWDFHVYESQDEKGRPITEFRHCPVVQFTEIYNGCLQCRSRPRCQEGSHVLPCLTCMQSGPCNCPVVGDLNELPPDHPVHLLIDTSTLKPGETLQEADAKNYFDAMSLQGQPDFQATRLLQDFERRSAYVTVEPGKPATLTGPAMYVHHDISDEEVSLLRRETLPRQSENLTQAEVAAWDNMDPPSAESIQEETVPPFPKKQTREIVTEVAIPEEEENPEEDGVDLVNFREGPYYATSVLPTEELLDNEDFIDVMNEQPENFSRLARERVELHRNLDDEHTTKGFTVLPDYVLPFDGHADGSYPENGVPQHRSTSEEQLSTTTFAIYTTPMRADDINPGDFQRIKERYIRQHHGTFYTPEGTLQAIIRDVCQPVAPWHDHSKGYPEMSEEERTKLTGKDIDRLCNDVPCQDSDGDFFNGSICALKIYPMISFEPTDVPEYSNRPWLRKIAHADSHGQNIEDFTLSIVGTLSTMARFWNENLDGEKRRVYDAFCPGRCCMDFAMSIGAERPNSYWSMKMSGRMGILFLCGAVERKGLRAAESMGLTLEKYKQRREQEKQSMTETVLVPDTSIGAPPGSMTLPQESNPGHDYDWHPVYNSDGKLLRWEKTIWPGFSYEFVEERGERGLGDLARLTCGTTMRREELMCMQGIAGFIAQHQKPLRDRYLAYCAEKRHGDIRSEAFTSLKYSAGLINPVWRRNISLVQRVVGPRWEQQIERLLFGVYNDERLFWPEGTKEGPLVKQFLQRDAPSNDPVPPSELIGRINSVGQLVFMHEEPTLVNPSAENSSPILDYGHMTSTAYRGKRGDVSWKRYSTREFACKEFL